MFAYNTKQLMLHFKMHFAKNSTFTINPIPNCKLASSKPKSTIRAFTRPGFSRSQVQSSHEQEPAAVCIGSAHSTLVDPIFHLLFLLTLTQHTIRSYSRTTCKCVVWGKQDGRHDLVAFKTISTTTRENSSAHIFYFNFCAKVVLSHMLVPFVVSLCIHKHSIWPRRATISLIKWAPREITVSRKCRPTFVSARVEQISGIFFVLLLLLLCGFFARRFILRRKRRSLRRE